MPLPGNQITHLKPQFQVGDRVVITYSKDFSLWATVIAIRVNFISTPSLTYLRYLVRWDWVRTDGWDAWHGEEAMSRGEVHSSCEHDWVMEDRKLFEICEKCGLTVLAGATGLVHGDVS